MKSRTFLIIVTGMFLFSCNNIPNKTIFEPLDTNTLATIIKKDTLFIPFYEELQENIKDLNEIEKARYNDITYRNLYSMIEFSRDTAKINPLRKQWEKEWNDKFGIYDVKIDSVINYWIQYKKDHSLDKYVKIEFAGIDKEYYTYSYDIKNVNFAFRLIPLLGKVEQIRFNYRYTAKIDDVKYAEKHHCISTSPFNTPVTLYWEAEYYDEKRLKNISSSEFKRDYDILFEITELRKDGINYSLDDLEIPNSITEILETDSIKYPFLYQHAKREAITELLCNGYKGRYEYMGEQYGKLLLEKFPEEATFMNYLGNR